MLRIGRPVHFAPLRVQLEVTWRCNWRCVHCYQDDHLSEPLRLERLTRLFDELAAAGALHLIITGGEPLVRRDILEVLAAIRERGLAITLYTNGHAVTEEIADRLADLVAGVELSLLAGEERMHDTLARVPGSFRRVWKAIDAFLCRDIPVVVKTTVLRPAYPTLKRLEQDLKQRNVEWLADPEISRSYAGHDFPLQHQLDKDELRQFFTDFPEFLPLGRARKDPGAPLGLCLAARQFCFIDAFGNVYPCLSFKSACDVEEARGQRPAAKLGNIQEQSFQEIWEAPFARAIRAASSGDFTTCSTCHAWNCQPCMALNYEEHGKLFEPSSVVCSMTKASQSLVDPSFVPASELRRRSSL